MTRLTLYLDGIGLIVPGLPSWDQACAVLSDRQALALTPTVLPAVDKLPPAERRRVGAPVKLAMAIGFAAADAAMADVGNLATVFSSTEADCDNTHAILETLASADRALSPTRFHNSVHNAASGYWGIATGSRQPSTSLCAYDATFGAGLLEAATQAISSGQLCMVLAYDTVFPKPMQALRPIVDAMGVALVLNPQRSTAAKAQLDISLTQAPATPMTSAELEHLRVGIPVARCLPLLAALANRHNGAVVIDYLDSLRLSIDVTCLN